MKLWVNIFLFVFITFLATPTIIGIVEEEADTSYFYNVSEEEENHAPFNEIESLPILNYAIINLPLLKLKKLNVLMIHNLSFTTLSHQIFSPPPNFS